eukprot:TRINITY_DN3596_c0_g1_i1.p1 TRINITY_DN3596_c0_g1~~TRINITY_DN3596_c0_g1_i1.p1  ORF type:complete len:756 (-),score=113.24 TRINITY_DN3596_c0_g1_i1:150-2417(-)
MTLEDVSRATYRRLIEEVYEKWKPENLYKVPDLMQKYRGLERDILDKAVNMYVFSKPREEWEPLIVSMYQRFKPGKLRELDKVLEKNKENPAQLYTDLCKKYIPRLRPEDPPLHLLGLPTPGSVSSPLAMAAQSDSQRGSDGCAGDAGDARPETIHPSHEVKSEVPLEVAGGAKKDTGPTVKLEIVGDSSETIVELPAEPSEGPKVHAPQVSEVVDDAGSASSEPPLPGPAMKDPDPSKIDAANSPHSKSDRRGEIVSKAAHALADTRVAEATAADTSTGQLQSSTQGQEAHRRQVTGSEVARRDRRDGSPRQQSGGSGGGGFGSGRQQTRVVAAMQRPGRYGDVRDIVRELPNMRDIRDVRDVRHANDDERRNRRRGSGGGNNTNDRHGGDSRRHSYRPRTRSRSPRRSRDCDPRSQTDQEWTNGWSSHKHDDNRGRWRGSEQDRPRRVELKARPPSPVSDEANGASGKRPRWNSRSRSPRTGRHSKAQLKAAPIRPNDATTSPSRLQRPGTSMSTRKSPDWVRGYERRGGEGYRGSDRGYRDTDRDHNRDRRRRDSDTVGHTDGGLGVCAATAGSSAIEKKRSARSDNREQEQGRAVDGRDADVRDRDKAQRGDAAAPKHPELTRHSPGTKRPGASTEGEMARRREDTPVASRRRAVTSSVGIATESSAKKTLDPPIKDDAGDVDSFLVGRALRAFMAATPRVSMNTGSVPKLLQATLEHGDQQLQFTLANTTTLGEVAHMYGQWLRTLRADR